MKVVFMGTPAFAVPPLEKLIEAGHEVAAVVTQADSEKNRKGEYVFSEVKNFALGHDLPLFQFEKIRRDGVETLKEIAPEIIITAAYGQILSQEVLDIPKYGVVNIHASLLPKYRGSSPVQWAIANGEAETGITIMQTALGLDTGDILSQESTFIEGNETASELMHRLSVIGADLLVRTLKDIETGSVQRTAQNEEEATKCRMIKKEDGLIDWNLSSAEINNRVRGFNPWPCCYSFLDNERIKIYSVRSLGDIAAGYGIADINLKALIPGEILTGSAGQKLIVSCGAGFLEIMELQISGKSRVCASEFLRGHNVAGKVFVNE